MSTVLVESLKSKVRRTHVCGEWVNEGVGTMPCPLVGGGKKLNLAPIKREGGPVMHPLLGVEGLVLIPTEGTR